MEIVMIAVIATLAFAAVLVPLFRRDAGADAREFRVDTAPGDVLETPVVLLTTDDAVEREVLRYRAALRAGTVCGGCGQANPPDALYCYECGNRLPRDAAKEFE